MLKYVTEIFDSYILINKAHPYFHLCEINAWGIILINLVHCQSTEWQYKDHRYKCDVIEREKISSFEMWVKVLPSSKENDFLKII